MIGVLLWLAIATLLLKLCWLYAVQERDVGNRLGAAAFVLLSMLILGFTVGVIFYRKL
jgi:hypothetical protein